MKIYVIRHGQTTGDVEDRYGGAYDDHLTPLGISQAKDMAESLMNENIEIIYSSSLIRAQETAKLLQDVVGVEIETVPDLRERNQNGILSGMVRADARAKYPELAQKVADPRNTIEGAEDFDTFSKRVVEAVNRIANSGYEVVAIITHGGPIRRILENVLLGSPDAKIEDCAWLLMEYKEGVFSLIKKQGITS